MGSVDCFGYRIYENGEIIKLSTGEKINGFQVIIKFPGEKDRVVRRRRLIYWAFHQEDFDLASSLAVKSKDESDCLSSLYLEKRGKEIKGEKNHLAKLTDEQVLKIREEYKNGLIRNLGQDKNNPLKRVSYRSLAIKYGVSHQTIKHAVKKSLV